MQPSVQSPRFLFITENIGEDHTCRSSFRKILTEREDLEVEFLDGRGPGPLGRILGAPIPGLASRDLDLQPLRAQLVHSWIMKQQVRKRLAQGSFDAVHLYTQNTLLGGACILRRIPTVITTDRTSQLNACRVPHRDPTPFTAWLSKLMLFLERPVLKTASKVFADNREVMASLLSEDYLLPPSLVQYLELGIHSPFFTEPLPSRSPGKVPHIVFLGTGTERGGGRLLLDIWRAELKGKADLTLVTREKVPIEPGLQVINDLEPGDSRLGEIFAGADIMCLPPTIEQDPHVILEAMAAGLAVIAHPHAAISEMILEGETGYLVDFHHRAPVVEALHRLVDDPQLRISLGEAGHHRVRQRYNLLNSAETIVEALVDAAGLGSADEVAADPVPPVGVGAEVFAIHDALSPELAQQWEELSARVATRFAARPSYAWTWFEALGKGELALATVHRGNQLVALIPLHARKRLGITVHRWLGHGLGVVGEAIAETPADLKILVAELENSGVVLELTHVPEDSPLLAELLAHDDWMVDYRQDDHCPGIQLPPGLTTRDLRSSRTLSQLRRGRVNTAKKFGAVEFAVIRTVDELDKHWAEMARVCQASWDHDTVKRLNLMGEKHHDFTHRFLSEEATKGHLLVIAILVDTVMAGFSVQLQTGERAEGWFTRFDPVFGSLRPGHQIIEHFINIHDEEGVTEYDLMIGPTPYKQEWETVRYEVGTVFAVSARRSRMLPLTRGVNSVFELARTSVATGREMPPKNNAVMQPSKS